MTKHKEESRHRAVRSIAVDIHQAWPNIHYAAAPYLAAMMELDTAEENYFQDSGYSIIRYFLSNAGSWRGERAAQIKAELKAILAGG